MQDQNQDPRPNGPSPHADESVLDAVERSTGQPARLSLFDSHAGETPVLSPGTGAADFMPRRRGAYQVLGEIARGGMGRILKGHDADLGRDVAIKVLDPRLAGRVDVLRRFVEEAQVGGQLQHPGVVPVYELGLLADERPYFTMKLVKGRTLADLFTARRSPTEDRGALLRVFESICQTIAYAHSKGVIHRDLKPANVMVGSFGEVQVVDWGLSKVLRRGGVDDELRAQREGRTQIETVRSGPVEEGSGSDSLAGSVLGTPAYMPPEQARGEVERLDERADVFALGAILCELLTGRPPYVEREGAPSLVVQASKAALEDAEARLAACGGEEELVALARECLAPAPAARPRNAEAVARAVHDHLAATEERARRAETQAAEARVRATAERKARRLTLALAATGAVATFVIGAGWLWREKSQREESARVERGLEDLRGQVLELQEGGGPEEALQVARGALVLADGRPPGDVLRARAAAIVEQAEAHEARARARRERAARDAALFRRLDELRLQAAMILSAEEHAEVDAGFDAAFRAWGLAIDADLVRSVEVLRDSGLGDELAPALDDWASVRRWAYGWSSERAGDLNRVAIDMDPDPVRLRLREALVERDARTLLEIAGDPKVHELPASTVWVLGNALKDLRRSDLSLAILARAIDLHPGDLRLRIAAVNSAIDIGRWDVALRHVGTAEALRPDLEALKFYEGLCLNENARFPEAVRALEGVLQVERPDRQALVELGWACLQIGDDPGAVRAFERMVDLGIENEDDIADLALARLRAGTLSPAEFDELVDPLARTQRYSAGIYGLGLVESGAPAARLEHALDLVSTTVARDAAEVLWHARSALLLALERHEESLEVCRKAAQDSRAFTSPDQWILVVTVRARALGRLGRAAEGREWLVEARRVFEGLSDDEPEAWSASVVLRSLREAEAELG